MGAAASAQGLSEETAKALEGMPDAAKEELKAQMAKMAGGGAAQSDEEKAAAKMQAMQRGNLTRKAANISKWGRTVFKQFDTNKDGKLDKKELTRALKSLPKTKPKSMPPGAKFQSVDEMITAMDDDGDGSMDIEEWLANLATCAGLATALAEAVNDEGKVANFRSFEEQKAKREKEVAALKAKESRTDEEEAEMKEYEKQIESLAAKIVEANANEAKAAAEPAADAAEAPKTDDEAKAAAKMQAMQRGNLARKAAPVSQWGRKVFKQYAKDGKLSKKEITEILGKLPKKKPETVPPGTKFQSVDEMMTAMDADGDGTVDLDEWLVNLATCAGLAAALAENVTEDGKVAEAAASS